MSVYVAISAVGLALLLTPAARADDSYESDDSAEDTLPESGPRIRETFTARITGYAPGCGSSGRTATGTVPAWLTVATDPRTIPLGSRLLIDGLEGTFTARDTGSGIRGPQIDVFFPTCAQANAWGVRYRTVAILVPEATGWRKGAADTRHWLSRMISAIRTESEQMDGAAHGLM